MSVTTTSTATPARFTKALLATPVTPVTPVNQVNPPSMVASINKEGSRHEFTVTFNRRLVAPNDTTFVWCVPDDKSTIGRRRTNAELFVRAISATSGIISCAKLRYSPDGSVLTFTILGARRAKKAELRLQLLAHKYLGITDVTFSRDPA